MQKAKTVVAVRIHTSKFIKQVKGEEAFTYYVIKDRLNL